MIESRAVRSEELDTMLSLMCDAFGLPFSAARDLFYKDPYFDIEKKRVLTFDGEIASCLTIVEAPLWIGSALVKVAGIAGVATAPRFRRRGFASRLLLDSLPAIREMGCGLAALFPFSYEYYRKIGWAQAGHQLVVRVPRAALPAFQEARHVRAALQGDRADIVRLYDAGTRERSGRWIRDDRRWSYLSEHVKSHVVYKRNQTAGYAFFETRDEADGSKTLRILEMFCDSEEAQRGLIGYFANMREVLSVNYVGGMNDALGSGLTSQADIAPDIALEVRIEPGVMFRVVDLALALTQLAPNFKAWEGGLVLTIADSNAPRDWTSGAYLTGDGAGINIESLKLGDPKLRTRSRIDGDVRAWSKVLTGFHSLQDALSLNLLHGFGVESAAHSGSLFPRRELFIPPADHF
jgi:predicted acetyltransferase